MIKDPHSNATPATSTSASKWPQVLATLAATLGAFGCGTGIAWSSPVLPKVSPSECQNDCDLQITEEAASWIGPIFPLAAACVGPVAFFLLNKIGRKKTLIALSFPMLIGYILLTFVREIDSAAVLLTARFLVGFSGGAYALVAPYYVSEVAEVSLRGALASVQQLMATLGVLFVNALNINGAVDWSTISGICVCIPLLMVLALFFMPDSPKFLISKNRISEARQALRWFRGPNYDVDSEFKQILTSNKEEENIGGISLLELFTQKVYFVPFLIAMYGMFGQQFCGINVVFFYLQTIFDKANSTVDPSLASFLVALAQFGATFLAVLIVDLFGRRILLILSNLFMALPLFALGFYFFIDENKFTCFDNTTMYLNVTGSEPESGYHWKDILDLLFKNVQDNCNDGKFDADLVTNLGWLPVVSLMVFVIAFSIGFGPLAWTLNAEIHSPEAKRLCASIAFSTNWTFAFLVTKFEPNIEALINLSGTYFAFATICFVGTIIVYIFVPETKGKTPEDMKIYFSK